MSLAVALRLADAYKAATDEWARHWEGSDGRCIGCGELYPCDQEWRAARQITRVERRWKAEAVRLARGEQSGEKMSISEATWLRASGHVDGSALEVAFIGEAVITRDSKDPQGTVQAYTREEWATFIAGVKLGEFDG